MSSVSVIRARILFWSGHLSEIHAVDWQQLEFISGASAEQFFLHFLHSEVKLVVRSCASKTLAAQSRLYQTPYLTWPIVTGKALLCMP